MIVPLSLLLVQCAAAATSYKELANTDACVHGGACNLQRVLNVSAQKLSQLCSDDPRCECHNERWLKSDCSQQEASKGTTLYVKVAHPTPPTPPPPTPPLSPPSLIWPVPQKLLAAGPPLILAASFAVQCRTSLENVSGRQGADDACASEVVQQAIRRYSNWTISHNKIQLSVKDPSIALGAPQLAALTIVITNSSEHLGSSTNYSYTMSVTTSTAIPTATATCASVYAAIYALETFAQLVRSTSASVTTLAHAPALIALPHSEIHITDFPAYVHRGVLLDVGRRFYPLDLLEAIISGLAFIKMNVLHFHMSDFPAFRVESKVFPQLTR